MRNPASVSPSQSSVGKNRDIEKYRTRVTIQAGTSSVILPRGYRRGTWKCVDMTGYHAIGRSIIIENTFKDVL